MSDIEWGAPIAVDGVRPAWLRGDDRIWMHWREGNHWSDLNDESWTASDWIDGDWRQIDLFRLPATHPAYLAIAKGFEPWAGGNSAPGNWDQGDVLLRDGDTCEAQEITSWTNDGQFDDIIGYKKRQAEDVSDDTVTVKRMTEDEAREHWMQADASEGPELPHARGFIDACRYFGLIRESTQAETIAQKTGLTVDQVQSVLNEVPHGTR